jgi:hypothetical protein
MADNASMHQLVIKISLSVHGQRGMALEFNILNRNIYEHFH